MDGGPDDTSWWRWRWRRSGQGDGGLFPEMGGPASSSFTPSATSSSTDHRIHSAPRANLTYGGLTGVEGLSQEELFLWLPVKDIIVDDPKSGLILFDIGLAYKQLSLSLWDSGADFMQLKKKSRKEIGFHAQI
ncbi:hypothetical protein R6Q59_029727 [Mikania micrantha]